MNKCGRNQPLYLKTYGKHSRKVERWLSPDIRKIAFASTSSSDLSIGEQVGLNCLRKRKRTLSTACSRPARAAKKKALKGLRESDSDTENAFDSSPQHSLAANQKRRRTVRVKPQPKRNAALALSASESEDERTAGGALSGRGSGASGDASLKTGSSVGLPSYLSRFVTRRRRGVAEKPRVSQASRMGQKTRVSSGSGKWNSSEDFVKSRLRPGRFSPTRRRRPLPLDEDSVNTSSELASPVPDLRGARSVLKAVSLNSTAASRCSASGYKKPLLSSTPSLSSRSTYRHLEPSISEISCSMEDMEEPFKASVEAPRNLVLSGQRELRVLLERSVEKERNLLESPPESRKAGLPVSAGESCVVIPEHSAELFSHLDCESEVKNRSKAAEDVPSLENLSVQFVSAKTHLDSVVASLRERGTPVVVLERTDLSDRRSGEREKRGEDTYSSCVDSEPAAGRLSTGDEVARETDSRDGRSDGSQGEDAAGRIQENHEHQGAGSGSGGCDESASVERVAPPERAGRLSGNGNGSLGENKKSRSFGMGEALSPATNSGHRVSVVEEGKDLFLEGSEIEPEYGSRGSLRTAASPENPSLSPKDAAADTCPPPADSVEACLRKRWLSVQSVVLLEPLDLSKWIQGPRRIPARGSNPHSEPRGAARGSESQLRSPVHSDPQERPGSSPPERPCGANPEQVTGKPDGGLRRRLSSMFSSDKAKSSSTSSGSAPSPSRKRGLGKARNQGGPPKDRPGTGRKACVSGLSVSRWAKNDSRRQRPKNGPSHSQLSRSGDCTLFDFPLRPDFRKQPDAGSSLLQAPSSLFPRTPLRVEPLNISSLLADFTPESLTTHTWSRLKAALSVHKKKKAFFTPQKLNLSHAELHGDGSLDGSVCVLGSPRATPLAQHLKASLLRSATATPVGSSLLLEDITDAEKLYLECQQDGPVPFEQCIPPHRMQLCRKVGEGTFGEVFTTTNDANQTVALKIVPIEGVQKVNGEDQKSFGEILHEVIISKELSSLDAQEMNKTNGFIGLNNLHCVRGSYPELLLRAWDKFDKQRGSENDRPDMFEEDQLFLILEFEFGGSDLEAMQGKLSSLAVAKSILHQVTAALAVAERALCFEHRDLHWGNILVKTTKEKTGTYVLNGSSHSIETKGVHVNIIDYSLSRLEIDGLTVSCDISADEALFMGKGDYQFDIYRKMRQENNNSWSEFNPHTNVLWIHYLADKLLNMNFRNRAQTKPMRELKKSLVEFHRDVLAYGSATSVLDGCSLFREP